MPAFQLLQSFHGSPAAICVRFNKPGRNDRCAKRSARNFVPSGLEHLPIELQRNFTLMRDLDARAQGLMKDIDKLADDYLKNVKKESPEKKKEQLTHIQNLFNKAKEYGDDKVQLAIQTYELVDKHIRRLDSDLARFEAEIQDKALNSSRAQEEGNASKKGRKKLKEKEKRKKGAAGASSEDESKTARKKQKKGKISVNGGACQFSVHGRTKGKEVFSTVS